MKKTTEKYLWTTLAVLAVVMLIIAAGAASVLEVYLGTDYILEKVFDSWWFECLFAGMACLLLCGLIRFQWYKRKFRLRFFVVLSLLTILAGSGLTHFSGLQGTTHLVVGETGSTVVATHKTRVEEEGGSRKIVQLPIRITLEKLRVERYPGTLSPRYYEASLRVNRDGKPVLQQQISLNHPMKFNGYRIFLLSFDSDTRGAVFLVSYDYWGTILTYTGYFALFLSMLLSFLNPAGRFRTLLMQTRTRSICMLLAALFAFPLFSTAKTSESKTIHLKKLSQLAVYNAFSSRYEPFYSFATEHVRKITAENSPDGMDPLQLVMQLITEPAGLNEKPLITVSPKIQTIPGGPQHRIAYNNLFDSSDNYLLTKQLTNLYASDQRTLTKEEQELLKLDDRVNLYESLADGQSIRIFPDNLPDSIRCKRADALFAAYKNAWIRAERTGQWQFADSALQKLEQFQKKCVGFSLPSEHQLRASIFYTRFNPFNLLRWAYLALTLLMFCAFIPALIGNRGWRGFFPVLTVLAGVLFVLLTGGMILRGYVSGHLPFGNGYEAILLVAWTLAGCGLLFRHLSHTTTALSVAMTAVMLMIASMSWMNPAITNLAPVLSSGWLMLHVSVVTLSYGFLGLASSLGLLNAFQIILRGFFGMEKLTHRIQKTSIATEIVLWTGILFLIAGCMLGAVWANNSWGSYWGWDSKESWALISILIYTGMALGRSHKMLGDSAFSLGVFLSLGTLLTTFLGANYFFAGMHAYAGGSAPAGLVPGLMGGIVFALIIIFLTCSATRRYLKRLL